MSAKDEKKKKKLQEKLAQLEQEMVLALTKKTSSVAEISVSEYSRRIAQLREQIAQYR